MAKSETKIINYEEAVRRLREKPALQRAEREAAAQKIIDQLLEYDVSLDKLANLIQLRLRLENRY